MWQDNLSWKEGLYYNIPFKRGQTIKPGEPRAFFTRVNNSADDDWPNLRFEGIQGPNSPTYAWTKMFLSPRYYIVAIDTRVRKIKSTNNIQSNDNITGEVQLTINYQVIDLKALLNFQDPLEFLIDKICEAVRLDCSALEFQKITEQAVNKAATSFDPSKIMGVKVISTTNTITWPAEIINSLGQSTTQKITNKIKVEKLRTLGIEDEILTAIVLSKNDSDFETIISYMQAATQANKDQYNRELQFMQWMVEKDLMSGPELAKIKTESIDRLNKYANRPPLLTLPNSVESVTQLESGEEKNQKANDDNVVDPKKAEVSKPERVKRTKGRS